VGSLDVANHYASGQSSTTTGYNTGGGRAGVPGASPLFAFRSRIESFPFAAPFSLATNIGDLTAILGISAGQSSSTHGYAAGGVTPGGGYGTDLINQFPFSTPFTIATDIGNLSLKRQGVAGQQSSTIGYTSGGYTDAPALAASDVIDSFPFSSPFATATDIGNLSTGREAVSGQSSTTNGYTSGGFAGIYPATRVDTIDNFPFSSPFATATDVGNLTIAKESTSGHFSSTDGYVTGGSGPLGVRYDHVDRYPFSSPFTAVTNIGVIVAGGDAGMAGHQG